MEKKYEPVYLCWVETDFMGDRAVLRMTPHQRLMYRQLCQVAMFCSTRPYLPDDDNELYLLADADSLDHWKVNREAVLIKFHQEEIDGKPMLAHRRILYDWDRILSQNEAQRARAVKRWHADGMPRHADGMQPECKLNEMKGNESKGKEGKDNGARRRAYPKDFVPNESNKGWATKLGLDINAALEEFREFHTFKGNRYIDWHLAFNHWLRNSVRFSRGKPQQKIVSGDIFDAMKEQLHA